MMNRIKSLWLTLNRARAFQSVFGTREHDAGTESCYPTIGKTLSRQFFQCRYFPNDPANRPIRRICFGGRREVFLHINHYLGLSQSDIAAMIAEEMNELNEDDNNESV